MVGNLTLVMSCHSVRPDKLLCCSIYSFARLQAILIVTVIIAIRLNKLYLILGIMGRLSIVSIVFITFLVSSTVLHAFICLETRVKIMNLVFFGIVKIYTCKCTYIFMNLKVLISL